MPTGQDDLSVFDYLDANTSLQIPQHVLAEFIGEAQAEFFEDKMLAELHILRAMKAYAQKNKLTSAA